jgi:hypothetical protein
MSGSNIAEWQALQTSVLHTLEGKTMKPSSGVMYAQMAGFGCRKEE